MTNSFADMKKMHFSANSAVSTRFWQVNNGRCSKGDYAVILEIFQSYDRWMILVLCVLFEEIQKDLSQ